MDSKQEFTVVASDVAGRDLDIERAILEPIGARIVVADGTAESIRALAHDADAILNTYFPFDEDLISSLTRCKIISRYGIGVDNIDVNAAARAGIVVTNVPDYCIEEVATHTLALILSQVRKLREGDILVRSGSWGVGSLAPVVRTSSLVVGLIGLGRIGRQLVGYLSALNVTIVAFDPFVDQVDGVEMVTLDELLSRSDVVSLHCPLTPENFHLIDRRRLAQMQPQAVLVNTSRGPLIALDDLVEALKTGVISGAALDVFEVEPPDSAQFDNVPGLIVTPHMAFYSDQARVESATKAANQVRKVLTSEPPDYAIAPR